MIGGRMNNAMPTKKETEKELRIQEARRDVG